MDHEHSSLLLRIGIPDGGMQIVVGEMGEVPFVFPTTDGIIQTKCFYFIYLLDFCTTHLATRLLGYGTRFLSVAYCT